MPFKIIKGTFHVKGYRPDGDSIRFKAHDDKNWKLLKGERLSINSKKHVQLRIEAIDTLETHYAVTGGEVHQPLKLAQSATQFLLNYLKVSEQHDGSEGFILAKQTEKYGRPVAFVFSGPSSLPDGSDVYLDDAMLKTSLNYASLVTGHAYPTYYQGLFHDLRETLTAATHHARKDKHGVFPVDKTNQGVQVTSMHSITDDAVILPKLFRRIATYIASDPTPDMSAFKDWLETQKDYLLLLRNGRYTHLGNLVEVENQTVRLTELPEHIIFMEG